MAAATTSIVAGAWLLAGPAAAAGPDDHYFQWPLGECVEDKLVAGHHYDVLQDFDQENTNVGRCYDLGLKCRHAGYDMHRSDAPERTFDDPVLAMADGEVVDLIDFGDEGVGVLVLHDNGLYAHYVHLQAGASVVYVRRGQRVRAGQPLGRIMSYPYGTNNDHLHLEVRADLRVQACTSGQDCVEATDFVWQCKGNGYALAAATSSIDALSATAYGFSDPTSAYFGNRPPFPAEIAVERGPLDYFDTTDASAAAVAQLPANTLLSSPSRPQLVGEHGWYSVIVGEGDAATTAYARGFTDLGFGGDIAIGEVPKIGREWTPPVDEPLVDLRFGATGVTVNWGSGADAAVTGSLRTTPPYPDALPAEYCDKVGELDGATHLAVAVAAERSFVDGVAIDLSLRLDAFETEGTIAASGDADSPTWRLAVRKEGDVRRLVFEVTTEAKDLQSLAMDLPEPRCTYGAVPASACDSVWATTTSDCPGAPTACDPDAGMPAHCFEDFGYRQWRHVAARYDVGTQTFELLWDGARVGKGTASARLVDVEDRTVRIGEGLAAALDDVRVWAPAVVEEDEKADDFDGGGGSRGEADEGCACTVQPGSGAGGSLLMLLGLWGLRRRWA